MDQSELLKSYNSKFVKKISDFHHLTLFQDKYIIRQLSLALLAILHELFFVPDTNLRFSLLRKKSKQLLNACIKYQPRRSINESKLQGPIPSSRNVLVLGTFVLCRLSLLVNEVGRYIYVCRYVPISYIGYDQSAKLLPNIRRP